MNDVLKGILDIALLFFALFVTFILAIIISAFLNVTVSFHPSSRASIILHGIIWLFSLAVSIHIFVRIRATLLHNFKLHTKESSKNGLVDNTEKIGRYIKQK